ncbi:hypothetical protein [Flavobacterium restrictum]|uniref:SusE outer membrane protein domain-containing protein n=1 Tax=Flavobacterium restrictum TaxID=2594428 RepID=A0A553E2Z0_9FLAO|nr:hypothetical protein [Flavobacterium restrictum]TRX39408.1 hypothetical protein FNW21_08930 [Flavobacterium restrictum]
MKNILKTTVFAFLLIALGSCTNDKEPIPTANGFELKDASTTPPPTVLLQANDALVYNNMVWDRADNGVAAASTYEVIISDHDKDPNYVNPVTYTGIGLALAPETTCTLTIKEFNTLINQLPTYNCGVMNIDIRVKSTVGKVVGNAFIQYSNPITVAVTGYSTNLPLLGFVKDGATPAAAPQIAASRFDKFNDYEGYMYLEAGSYKFYQPDACGSFAAPIIYGGAGGILVQGGTTSIVIDKAGDYQVKADLTTGALKYSVKSIKAFGVFGLGVRNNPGSANAVPMTDEGNKNSWKITIELFKGRKFKFKSNDWIGDLVGTPASVPPGATTTLVSILGSSTTPNVLTEVTGTAGDITVPGTNDGTKQKYDLAIDVSKARNYTYTVTLNPN